MRAGINQLFEARIDGLIAERQNLAGKPAPDTFLAGGRALGAEPSQAAVFEDAQASVAAARAGRFGWVVGVDRPGSWLAAVAGFGGLRDYGQRLSFAPRLPSKVTRLSFGLLYRHRRLRVEVRSDRASYELQQGDPLTIEHHDAPVTVHPGGTETRQIPAIEVRSVPEPPPGRKPPRRHREA